MGPRHDPDRENCDRDLDRDFKKGSSIAINLLTVDEVFFISFTGKLVHNHLQKCLLNQKLFFGNFYSLSSGIFEIFDPQKDDC